METVVAENSCVMRRRTLIHLAGFGFQVFFKGNFEVEEFLAIGVFDGVEIQQPALERVREPADVIEEKAGASGVRFNDQGLKLEGVKVLFDIFVAGFSLGMDGERADGNLGAFLLPAGHEALDIFRIGGLDAVAEVGDEEDSGVAEGDGPVGVVGDDETDREYAMANVIDAEERHLLFGVVGVGSDGEFFVGVDFDGGEIGGGLDSGGCVVTGVAVGGSHGGQEQGYAQQKRKSAPNAHWARLYHFRG
jgi:hypothetical protein